MVVGSMAVASTAVAIVSRVSYEKAPGFDPGAFFAIGQFVSRGKQQNFSGAGPARPDI
jgi:hypothetical protein